MLSNDVDLKLEMREDLLGGIPVITAMAQLAVQSEWGKPATYKPQPLLAIPYALWANRGKGSMDVWIARSWYAARPIPAPTALATAKITDSVNKPANRIRYIHDGRYGPSSDFRETERFTWGPDERFIHIRDFKRQQEELAKQPPLTEGWLQCEWDEPRKLERTAVYWAKDRAKQVYWWTRVRGLNLDLPRSWRLLYRDGQEWKPVTPLEGQAAEVKADQLNELRFNPITTDAVRLQVEFKEYPAAVQEWKLE